MAEWEDFMIKLNVCNNMLWIQCYECNVMNALLWIQCYECKDMNAIWRVISNECAKFYVMNDTKWMLRNICNVINAI